MTQSLRIGGLERVIATLARCLDRSRFAGEVLCLREWGEFADELVAEGIPVHLVRWQGDWSDYLAFSRVAKLLRARRIDVMHTHNTDAFLTGGLARLLSGRRITHVHTDHARDFPDKWRYMVAEHVLSWGTHMVVGVSTHTTDNLARFERIARHRLTTIANGIDPSVIDRPVDRASMRAGLGIPPLAPVLGLGARLEAQKGIDVLLDAVATEPLLSFGAHVVIGGEGSHRAQLEAQARALGLAGQVHFLGARTDFLTMLRTFDVYVMPSRWEGLPMALLEAMAARLPIVASSVGGVPEVLTDEADGILVPAERPVALAEALAALLADPARRASLGAAARETFERSYSAGAMTRRYEALYLGRSA